MGDSSTSSLWEGSQEWQAKADDVLKATKAELSRPVDKPRRSAPSRPSLPHPAREEDELKQRQEWARTQITDINSGAKFEMESLEQLRSRQQEIYQEQLAEKSEVWEQLVNQRREEAAELRSMISSLSAAIASARSQAKVEIDDAKRKASESTRALRAKREKQIQQIAELTRTLEVERRQFDLELGQIAAASTSTVQQKQEQVSRLESTLASLHQKLREKEAENEARFKDQVRTIRELRAQLQQVREEENEKQTALMSMRKVCASTSKKISARKDEAASLKRQLAMLTRDNEELQGEIVRMETGMFPGAFTGEKSF
jgi:chromosome segregation ATPase